jgi:ribonuclease T1
VTAVARRVRRPQLALLALLLAIGIGYGVRAATRDPVAISRTSTISSPAVVSVSLSALPVQAAQIVHEIEAGGPFAFPANDGVVFDNNERRLPIHPIGYYHEYTVPTPGSADRGTRRVITGTGGEYYYTGDHYEHFQRVDLAR